MEMRCDTRALSLLGTACGRSQGGSCYRRGLVRTEHLSLTAGVRVVDSLDEALEHIDKYGSGHSEAIVTEDYASGDALPGRG